MDLKKSYFTPLSVKIVKSFTFKRGKTPISKLIPIFNLYTQWRKLHLDVLLYCLLTSQRWQTYKHPLDV
jgi:hypothetical protein